MVYNVDICYMETFTERLKCLMHSHDCTAKDLGQKTGISYRTIENWLSSKSSMPRADSAVLIAQSLNTSVEYLVLGKIGDIKSNIRLSFDKYIDNFTDEEIERIRGMIELAFPGRGSSEYSDMERRGSMIDYSAYLPGEPGANSKCKILRFEKWRY